MDSLRQAGAPPDHVDTVAYTHLHSDHTGWTTTGDDHALTFADATHYIGSDAEWRFRQEHPETPSAPDPVSVSGPPEARVETTGDGRPLAPGADLTATPGHPPATSRWSSPPGRHAR